MNLSGPSFVRTVMLAVPLFCLCAPGLASDSPTPTRETIVERIHVLTGLDTLFPIDSIKIVPATAANIPFLTKELDGKTAIKVTFKRGKLNLKSSHGDEGDKYDDRQFVVLLDADAKILLSVTSTISKKDPDIHPELPLGEAEKYINLENERYESFPTSDPTVTFLGALEIIQKYGSTRPILAQEIDGFYLMYSEMKRPSRPEWIITLRGYPPLETRYPFIPVWQRNHMREFVDAVTGSWLSSETAPGPSE